MMSVHVSQSKHSHLHVPRLPTLASGELEVDFRGIGEGPALPDPPVQAHVKINSLVSSAFQPPANELRRREPDIMRTQRLDSKAQKETEQF